MTNHSNPITDIYEILFRFANYWRKDNTGLKVMSADEANQALYEAVAQEIPEARTSSEETYSDNEPLYFRHIGYNKCREQVLANVRALFGVEDVGNLATPEATNSQPQLADSQSDDYKKGWDDCALHITMQHYLLSPKDFKQVMLETRNELMPQKYGISKEGVESNE